jgi:hypothetical protein
MSNQCNRCGDDIDDRRYKIGYRTCLFCGEEDARAYKHCAVPLSKSNYILVTDVNMLKQLNPKKV